MRLQHHAAAPSRPTELHTFEQVFRENYSGLCRYAHVITKARDAAEEVVNDVFLKYWATREELQIRSSVRAYLVTATRNHAIDRLRKTVRQRSRCHELTGDFTADYAMPHEIVIGEETNHLIEAAVEALPPQGKLIFKMSRDNSMTYSEIASSLGLSVKTIEAHMGRSLKFLRATLREKEVLN